MSDSTTSSSPSRGRPARIPVGLRVRVWWQRPGLDRRLAHGEDPRSCPALQRRAAQITQAGYRDALVAGLERVLETVDEPPFTLSSRAPIRRTLTLVSRGALVDLIRELEHDDDVHPRGVALTHQLLTDVRSSLYTAATADDISHATRAATRALHPRPHQP